MLRATIAVLILVPSVILFFNSWSNIELSRGLLLYDLSKIGLGLGLGLFVPIFIDNYKTIKSYLYLLVKGQLFEDIRFSYSYLFRIEVKDEDGISRFLLVRNSKRNYKTFQPPGGVYKIFNSSDLQKINAINAKYLHEEGDLRIRFKGYNLNKVLKYINYSGNIESDHSREFYEELLETKILPSDVFPFVNARKRGQVSTGVRYSTHLSIYEYNVYDIIDLQLSEKQVELIEKLCDSSDHGESYLLATTDIIEACGMDKNKNRDEYSVTEHTHRIIEL